MKIILITALDIIILLNICGSAACYASGDEIRESKDGTKKAIIRAAPKFAAGEETRIDVKDKDIGGDYFVVYVPNDYTGDSNWPVIFFLHGRGGHPSTKVFRNITEGKGFIIIGMEYVEFDENRTTVGSYINYLKREQQSIFKAKRYVSKYLKIDNKRLFLTGISRGGFRTAGLIEQNARPWAGAVIMGAGRIPFSSPVSTSITDNDEFLRNKPIYIGVGEEDKYNDEARKAGEFFRRRGAKVTFEEYKGLGHQPKEDSEILRNWLATNSAVERHREAADANEQAKTN